MSTQRYISTSFWTDRWIRQLDPSERYLYLYLLTNPQTNIAGVYQITLDRIAFDTGYDERTLLPMLDRFAAAGKAYFVHDEWVIIPTWPRHQRYEKSQKIKQGIEKILADLPQHIYNALPQAGYNFDTLSIPYQYPTNYSDSDTDTDGDRDSKDAPPKTATKADTTHPETGRPMNQHTYTTLVTAYGQRTVDDYFQRVCDYEASHGKTYKEHAATVRNWLKRDNVPTRPAETKWPVDAGELSGVSYD